LDEKSLVGLLLCATSVFSVSLWLTEFAAKLTTETQRTQRLHREEHVGRLFVQSQVKVFLLRGKAREAGNSKARGAGDSIKPGAQAPG